MPGSEVSEVSVLIYTDNTCDYHRYAYSTYLLSLDHGRKEQTLDVSYAKRTEK